MDTKSMLDTASRGTRILCGGVLATTTLLLAGCSALLAPSALGSEATNALEAAGIVGTAKARSASELGGPYTLFACVSTTADSPRDVAQLVAASYAAIYPITGDPAKDIVRFDVAVVTDDPDVNISQRCGGYETGYVSPQTVQVVADALLNPEPDYSLPDSGTFRYSGRDTPFPETITVAP